MAVSLPSYSRTINNEFVQTWDMIRAEAIDNVLDAIPTWAALKHRLSTQNGGVKINRTIRYGEIDAEATAKGATLPVGEPELKTMAQWDWRILVVPVQADLVDDAKNAGKFQITSYRNDRLQAARDGLQQKLQAAMYGSIVTAETGNEPQGLNDMIPVVASQTTGTYGGINRPTAFSGGAPSTGNTFWGSKYKATTAPVAVNLLTDMRNLYNTIGSNLEPPNLIIMDQDWFEIYEEFGVDQSQIAKKTGGLADLGFETLLFKGKDMIWDAGVTNNSAFFLNTNYIDVVYHPAMWFDITDFKPLPTSTSRVAHIFCMYNVISTQLRRHGLLYT